jgi:hypothetical protein
LNLRTALALIAIAACSAPPPVQPSPTTTPTLSVATPSSIATPSPLRSPSPIVTPTASDVQLISDLIAFASAPGPATAAHVPFAPQVGLGLGEQIRVTRSRIELNSPAQWVLNLDRFRGRAGTASALDLLSEGGPTVIVIGPHDHCASPPLPPPSGLSGARRISVQRTGVDTCLLWWTVDIFVSASGQIEAITLDLWGP